MDLELSKKYAKAQKLSDKEKEYLQQFTGTEYTEEKNKIIEKHKAKLGLIESENVKGENKGYNKGKKYTKLSNATKLAIMVDTAILDNEAICDKYGISIQQLYKLKANAKAQAKKEEESKIGYAQSTDSDNVVSLARVEEYSKLATTKRVNEFMDDRLSSMMSTYDKLLNALGDNEKIENAKLSEVTTAFNAIADRMEKIQLVKDGISNSNGTTNIVIMPSVLPTEQAYDNVVFVGDEVENAETITETFTETNGAKNTNNVVESATDSTNNVVEKQKEYLYI